MSYEGTYVSWKRIGEQVVGRAPIVVYKAKNKLMEMCSLMNNHGATGNIKPSTCDHQANIDSKALQEGSSEVIPVVDWWEQSAEKEKTRGVRDIMVASIKMCI